MGTITPQLLKICNKNSSLVNFISSPTESKCGLREANNFIAAGAAYDGVSSFS
jgi:hypothetical protein